MNRSLLALFSVNFIGAIGFSLVMPFLVFVVTDFGGNPVIYGIIGASYSFFQLIGAPVLGRYSDRVGRRKALLISQIGTLAAWMTLLVSLMIPVQTILSVDAPVLGSFTLTLPLLILFLSRAVDGLTGGNISVANAYLADISTEENQSQNFGKMASSSNLGFIIGPVVAGVLGGSMYGEKIPVAAAIVVSLVGVILIARYLPESKPKALDEPPCKDPNRRLSGKELRDCYERQASRNGLRAILSLRCVPTMLGLYFLIFLAFNLFYTAFPLHASQGLGWNVTELGLFFSMLSGLMILVQGPVLARVSQRFAKTTLAASGCLLMVASFALISTGNPPLTILATVFFALGNGLMWPSFMAILSGIGSKDQQGAIQGIATSSGSLASIFGLILGGIIYARAGTLTFALGGLTFLIVFLLMLRVFIVRRKIETPVPAH